MGAIFNGSVYHGFEVNNDGAIVERYGVPPTNLNVLTDPGRAKPGAEVAVRRLTNDKGEVIYPGDYFIEALSFSGDDVVILVWNHSTGWQGAGYGG